ncbi:putative phage tail protein [Clostridium sp.]|uniref:putative phage tail protein n=1 Tax=Clostridium sp. TaxID=1506 RepID=UPI0032177BEF
MIDSVNYKVNGEDYTLEDNGGGLYSRILTAPNQEGNYFTSVEVIDMAGNKVLIDSTDERFNMLLSVAEEIPLTVNLLDYLPEFLRDIREFKLILGTESVQFSQLTYNINKNLENNFLDAMSKETIERFEKFLGVVGEGTIEQRRSYLKALVRKGEKLSEESIRSVIKTLTGAEALIRFYTGSEVDAPFPGQGTLSIRVLSPDSSINYRFEDVARTIVPLMPAHIRLELIKYFATWADIRNSYSSWETLKTGAENWTTLKNYIPPVVRV